MKKADVSRSLDNTIEFDGEVVLHMIVLELSPFGDDPDDRVHGFQCGRNAACETIGKNRPSGKDFRSRVKGREKRSQQ